MNALEMREARVGDEFEVVELDGKLYFKISGSNPPHYLTLNLSQRNIGLMGDDGNEFVLCVDDHIGNPHILRVNGNRHDLPVEERFEEILIPPRKFKITE